MKETYLWALFYLFAVLGVVGGMMVLTEFIGPKRKSAKKFYPYESGMDLLDDTRKKMNVRFYLVAMVFLLFDIEAIFLIPWAVLYKSIGIVGVVDMGIFMVLILVALLYVIKKKTLNWREEG